MMGRKIFVNLPVKDLQRTMDFWTRVGFEFDQTFTDENAACLVIGDNIYAMLVTESFFKSFTKKEIVDAGRGIETILAISTDSRQQVDELADKALAAGGQPATEPQDQGFMYSRNFQDPDGHQWEFLYMDLSAVPEQG